MCEHHALQLGIAMVVYLNGLLCSFPQLHIYRTNKLVPSSPHPHSHASPTANSKKKQLNSSLETKVTQLNLWLVCLCILSLKQICSEHLAIKVVNIKPKARAMVSHAECTTTELCALMCGQIDVRKLVDPFSSSPALPQCLQSWSFPQTAGGPLVDQTWHVLGPLEHDTPAGSPRDQTCPVHQWPGQCLSPCSAKTGVG